jgi:hypothetical protein
MWPFAKPLDDVRAEDLEALVAAGAREGTGLEFKEAMYQRRDPGHVRELLRDVASIANAVGGVLLIGMREDGDGTAIQLMPINDAEAEANRLITLCNTHIEERIPGLRAARVPIPGGDVIVVRIPTSYRKPHMIKFEGLTDFWIRHDRQKSRMSIAEIRSAIMATEDLTMKVEQFIADRRHAVWSPPKAELTYALMATPLLLEDGRVDISNPRLRALLQAVPTYRAAGGANISSDYARIRPTLHGVRAAEEDTTTLEVFRTGHVEFILLDRFMVAEHPDGRRIKAWAVAELIRNFVFFVEALRRLHGGGDVYLLTVSLWLCGGLAMPERLIGRFGEGRTNTFTDGRDLMLDPIHCAIDENPDHTTKRLLDRLWNAFGFDQCRFFDGDGRFAIPQP